MRSRKNNLISLFSLAFLLLITNNLFAQKKKIELLNADVLEFDESLGNGARRLLGNVSFKHENVFLDCDSAYLYSNNALDAFSNVHIQQGDSINMYGNVLKYNGNDKKAELFGGVRLIKKDVTLTTDNLIYDLNTSVANYYTPGKIINKDNTLTSKTGSYNSKSNEFFFKNDVVLVNPQYTMNSDTLKYNTNSKIAYFFGPTKIKSKENFIYCENGWYNTDKDISQFSRNAYIITKEQKLKGDSLYYDRNKGFGKAIKNVTIIDTTQNIHITGDYAEHTEETSNSVVTGNAVLMQIYNRDTLFLHADKLRATEDQTSLVTGKDKKERDKARKEALKDTSHAKILFAYNKVKFFKSDIQGKCDSLVYTYKDSTMRLYHDPILWSEKNQLTGEVVEIQTSKGEIKALYLNNSAFIVSQEDSTRYNQIKGKKMTGSFNQSKLYRIDVKGNGQSVYYAKDKDKLLGVNKAECTDIMILMKDDEVEKITFIKNPEATFYPIDELKPAELELKDFKWRSNERPMRKEDIFVW